MQLFVKTLTGATLTCDVEGSVADLKQQVAAQTGVPAEEIVLIHGMSVLEDEATFEALGLEKEATINMVVRLCGGKKKRKKKVYTKPKKIAHKHKKRPKAILEYFNVDNTGKITKLKIECEKCPAGKLH
jgi:small subunit ribosomal protein S27Ae